MIYCYYNSSIKVVIMDFDKTISNIIGGYELQYGIIYGNENIVFIKCGAGGTISASRSMSPTMVADYTLQLPDKILLEEKLREITMLADN